MKITLCLFCLLFIADSLLAQEKVEGRILTAEGSPIAYASVKLIQDSSLLVGGVTTELGTFELPCNCADKESIFLEVRHLSILTDTIPIRMVSSSIDLGDLKMVNSDVGNLEEVDIVATTDIYTRKADRFIFRVENNPLAQGGDALEAMSLTPGLLVTQEAIQMAGRGNVIVTVNDRVLNLGGDELIAYLRSLSADNIKQIEVIANPDARYDAEGNSGIINIVLRKTVGEGWELRSTTSWEQRSRPSISQNLSLNYRKKAVNVYGFYSPRIRRTRTLEETEVLYTDNFWLTNNERLEEWKSHSYQLGIDINLGPRTILGVVGEGLLLGTKQETATALTEVTSYDGGLDSTFLVNNDIANRNKYQTLNLNLKHELDSLGSAISADLDYFTFQNGQEQTLSTLTTVSSQESRSDVIESDAPQVIENMSFNLDADHAIGTKQMISWGTKITRTITNNDFEFRIWDGDSYVADPTRSNEYLYTENIQALYASYERSWEKTQLEIGLRAENTIIKGESLTLDTINTQKYLRLFPSLFIQKSLADQHGLNLYYGIRLRRPEFWELNPFKYYINPYTYSEGNPALTPSFTHNLELTYSFKNRYSATLAASTTVNHFQQVPVIANDENFFYYTRANVGQQQSLGLSLFAPVQLTTWWNIDFSAWAAINAQKVPYLDDTVEYVQPYLWSAMNHRFIISEKGGMTAQLNISYSTRNQSFLYQQEGVFLTNISLRKQLWNNRASLSATLYDVFKTFPYRVNVDYQNQQMSFLNTPETRFLQLSFTYRFGDDQVRQSRWRQKGNQEEQNRSGI